MFFSPLLLILGCASTTLEGVVVDADSTPISGATVTASEHDGCRTQTDEKGQFALECDPGDWTLTIAHDAHLTEQKHINVSKNTTNTLNGVMLIAIPSNDGLHALQSGRFVSLPSAQIFRTTTHTGKAKQRSFCIDTEQSTPSVFPQGEHTFLEKNVSGWRAFQMDENGCAYRDAKNNDGHWVVEHQQNPVMNIETINDAIKTHRWNVRTGDYFLADWSGFFVPTEPKSIRYSGHWVRFTD